MTRVDLVIPVHNEAASVERQLRDFDDALNVPDSGVEVRFVVCEDGSSDGTADIVRGLAGSLPIELVSSPGRKGYSRAVLDGLVATDAEVVAFVDGDGQYVPRDLRRLVEALGPADAVIGVRTPRRDHWVRKLMSWAFGVVYMRLFPVRLADPSCPYGAITRPALDRLLAGFHEVTLPAGFWWEFYARVHAAGLRIEELPVEHRERLTGVTQVYKPKKVPGIARVHLQGLLALRRELRGAR